MKLILIRHGETEHNTEDIITGQKDIRLTEKGVKQAEKLAERLEKQKFDAAYSSDLKRTFNTTKMVAERHNLELQPSEDLRERKFGKFEGKHKNEWRKIIEEHEGEEIELGPENGESLREVGERFLGKLNEIRDKHDPDDNVLIGGHGVALKATIMNLLNLEGKYYNKLEQDNTSINELRFSQRKVWKIIRMNDTAHLEP